MARHPILDNVPTPAPRPARRRWGFTVVLFIVAVTGYATMKHCAMGGLADSGVERGTRAVAASIIARDPEASRAAETYLVRAASTSVADRYPAFLIQTNRKIGRALAGESEEPIVAAIAAMDWRGARTLAADLGDPGTEPRASWERLIGDLERYSAARTP